MTLRQRQSLFARLICQHILWLYEQGYEVTLGEAWRPPEMVLIYAEQGIGSLTSVHPEKLALDINLFRGGRYLTSTESHRASGEKWEKRHPLCRWGGRFKTDKGPDGNHYSLGIGSRA